MSDLGRQAGIDRAGAAATGPKRLAIFVPSLAGGGAERVMAILAAGFARRGHQVDLVMAHAEGPYLAMIPPDVRIVDLGKRRVLATLPALIRYLRRERPDALLSALTHANVIALLARRAAGGRTRLVVSERYSWVATVATFRSPWDRLIQFLARRTYSRADKVVVVAQAMVDEFRRDRGLARARVEMVPNPVVTAALAEAARAEPDCAAFDSGAPVIVAAGRLEAQKGFDVLIRAFSILRAGREARLVILGEGADRAALEALVRALGLAGDVLLPGFTGNPFSFMRAADLFVLSSRSEGMPGALIQAMACGTPVVSTDCPTGPREVLEDGRWGTLVPVEDVEALAGAMAAALDSRDRPDVRQRAADFGEEKAIDRYLDILLTDDR